MYMTVEEYLEQEPCGSIHPNASWLICDKHGKCFLDWHATTYRNKIDTFTIIYQWGKDLENFVAAGNYPITGILKRIEE